MSIQPHAEDLQAGHIGKVVAWNPAPTQASHTAASAAAILGGLGSLGLVAAAWNIHAGAVLVKLLGRTGKASSPAFTGQSMQLMSNVSNVLSLVSVRLAGCTGIAGHLWTGSFCQSTVAL